MSKNALAFAAGFGGAYLQGKQRNQERERQQKDDEWKDEQRQYQREQQQREREQQISLADAVAPRTMVEGTAVTDAGGNKNLYTDPAQAAAARADMQAEAEMRGAPALADAVPAYGVTGTSRGNQITLARPDVDAMNTPDARMARVVDATMKTDPTKALTLQNAALTGKKAQMDMDEAARKRRAEIEREGMVGTVQAMRTGDPEAVRTAFNKQGDFKVEGDIKVTPRKRKAPWGAEVETYDYEATVIDKDGNKRPVKMNSLDAMVKMVDVQDLFKLEADLGSKLTLEGVKNTNEMNQIGARGAQDRSTIDHRVRSGADKSPVSREERMRYTTLFTEAGRRLGESQKALNTLLSQSGRRANTPGTPEYEQAGQLRAAISTYGEERSMYQGLLAESQTPAGRKSGSGGSGGSGAQKDGKPPKITTREAYDKLERGQSYVAPDGQVRIKN